MIETNKKCIFSSSLLKENGQVMIRILYYEQFEMHPSPMVPTKNNKMEDPPGYLLFLVLYSFTFFYK